MRARSSILIRACLAALTVVPLARAAEWVVGERGPNPWHFVAADGASAEVTQAGADMRVTFVKSGDERRLIAFEAPVACGGNVVSISCPYEVHLKTGTARLAVVAVGKDGDTWCKVTKNVLPSDVPTEGHMSLRGMTRAAFSTGAGQEVEWRDVGRIRIGLVIDGKAEGSFAVGPAHLSDQPYHASRPLTLQSPAVRPWNHGADPAARVTLTTPNEGPRGTPCWRFDFAFPGGRHMYAVPMTPIEDVDLDAYRAVEITYKAEIPEGIPGLLFMLIERDGTQYYADPPPPACADWKQLVVPFQSFKRGGWTKDENDRLDVDGVGSLAVAVHGTARPPQARGTVWVSALRLLP